MIEHFLYCVILVLIFGGSTSLLVSKSVNPVLFWLMLATSAVAAGLFAIFGLTLTAEVLSQKIDSLLFYVFSTLVCVGAVAVVATQNVVRMAFWLVVSLGSVAALFFLLHADFLGAAQLLIYVGGTVVLLVFGVMLTASGPYVQVRTSPAELILGSVVGGLLFFVLTSSICWVDWNELASRMPPTPGASLTFEFAHTKQPDESTQINDLTTDANLRISKTDHALEQQGRTVRQLGLGFLGLRPDRNLKNAGGIGLAPGYLLPFEIVSIHLLVVLIGAAYLARAKRRISNDEAQSLS